MPVDQNEEQLKELGKHLVATLEKAIEDGIIDREENDVICTQVKQIEEMVMHDKIITKKEATFMREVEANLKKYLDGVPRKFD
jgi:hypothetical protein